MKTNAVQQLSKARIPTQYGEFSLCVYRADNDPKEHLAIVMGDVEGERDVLLRVHSECFTGDVLGSQRCDCGEQLDRSLQLIARRGQGVVLYLRQEGRGIGLIDKLKAYNLQDEGHDTVDANILLGHAPDLRDYGIAALMIRDLGIQSIKLLTNNPKKISELRQYGIPITERVPLNPRQVNRENRRYLMTKLRRMDHLLDLDTELDGGRVSPAALP
jgi:GTP cyclohydrolase II